jgi:hypothetical protein
MLVVVVAAVAVGKQEEEGYSYSIPAMGLSFCFSWHRDETTVYVQ